MSDNRLGRPEAKRKQRVLIREQRTDLGNAKRLIALFGHQLRYVSPWKTWLVWDGRRWQRDVERKVETFAKRTVRALYPIATSLSDTERASLIAHAQRSERAQRIDAMARLARTEPGVSVRPNQLDRNPWLFNCVNGTVDLRTGQLKQHNRDDLITKLAPVDYDPEARLGLWERFLERVLGGNRDLTAFVQRVCGYALTGLTSEERAFLFIGGTASGKSTLLEALKATMDEYARTADLETFMRHSDNSRPRNDLARLVGARLVACSEAPPGRPLDERLVKQATGGDVLTARFLGEEHFEFVPQFTLVMAANHRPTVRDDDEAIWRRLLEIPFVVEIPEDERDPEVKATLRDPSKAGPAIFNWAVRGCLEWQRVGLRIPLAVTQATNRYRQDMSALGDFLEECFDLGADFWTPSQAIMGRYKEWSSANGYRFPLGPRRLRESLRNRGFEPRKRGSQRGWQGLKLREAG